MKIKFTADQINKIVELTGRPKKMVICDIEESYTTSLLYKNILENSIFN